MNGPQALKALIDGRPVRVKYWTPGNRIWREWHESLGEYVVIGDGTALFREDLEWGNAVWILESFADYKDQWEEYNEENNEPDRGA